MAPAVRKAETQATLKINVLSMADIWDEIHAVTAQQDELIKHRDWLRDQLAQVVEDLKPVRSRLRDLHREFKNRSAVEEPKVKGTVKPEKIQTDIEVVLLRNGHGLTFKEIGRRFVVTGSRAAQRFDNGIRYLRYSADEYERDDVIARIRQARIQSGHRPMYDDPLKGRH